jgi:competence protein CoiA
MVEQSIWIFAKSSAPRREFLAADSLSRNEPGTLMTLPYSQLLDFARRDDGSVVDASLLSPDAWRDLQVTYRMGELSMPCCSAPAVPKTSPNGLQFFAHAAGTCGSAPETIWHESAKQSVRDAARELGYQATLERPGRTGNKRWCADVWLDFPGGPVAIELQHSYQHVRTYLQRQECYENAGVRCLWLLMKDRYITLGKATLKKRYLEELGRNWPDGEGQCLRELPMAVLDLESTPFVRGVRLQAPLHDVLKAFVEGSHTWDAGAWVVDQDAQKSAPVSIPDGSV